MVWKSHAISYLDGPIRTSRSWLAINRALLIESYYIKITPIHLATSYSFLGVYRTDFESALSGISTKGEDLEDLAQDPTAEADDGSHRIRARGV